MEDAVACPQERSPSEHQRFHFILFIPLLNLPRIYPILNQSMVWYCLWIHLLVSLHLTVCFLSVRLFLSPHSASFHVLPTPFGANSPKIRSNCADFLSLRLHFFSFLGLTRTVFFIDVGTHYSAFFEGECKCG